MNNTEYTFNDVLINPKYSEVLSRSNVKLDCVLGNHQFTLPIISSNMKTITESNMASTMSDLGGLGILHRFCTIDKNVYIYKEAIGFSKIYGNHNAQIGVSIGVQEQDKQRFYALYEAGARIFCIDVAHGHHILVKNMLQYINNQLWRPDERKKITIIAGNIASVDAYFDLALWGADVVKCGIGPSPVCMTRSNTGVGAAQLSMLCKIYEQQSKQLKRPSIIADGGLKCVGDIAKALKYADMVMVGSMISGTRETPGNVYKGPDGTYYKVFGGSASGENKGQNKFVEGVTKTTPFRGKVKYIIKEIKEGLQSSCSYVGAHNLNEFKDKCEFSFISDNTSRESKF
jgi:IMP dehydrogenase